MSEENILIKKKTKKKKEKKKKKKKQLEKQDAVNISLSLNNQRTDKKPIIATDNYNNTLKEFDSIYTASKD